MYVYSKLEGTQNLMFLLTLKRRFQNCGYKRILATHYLKICRYFNIVGTQYMLVFKYVGIQT